jgi:hypothetical protein
MSGEESHETTAQLGPDVPTGEGIQDQDYKSRTGQSHIPVVGDNVNLKGEGVDPRTADSDQMLERDDREAIDTGNILDGGRTRGAAKKAGTYAEPGDEEVCSDT